MERAYRSLVPGPFVEESCWAVIIKLLRFKEKEIILIKAIQYPKEKKLRIWKGEREFIFLPVLPKKKRQEKKGTVEFESLMPGGGKKK